MVKPKPRPKPKPKPNPKPKPKPNLTLTPTLTSPRAALPLLQLPRLLAAPERARNSPKRAGAKGY